MARMGARRKTQGYQWRALTLVLLAALATGAVAVVLAPGAFGRPSPSPSSTVSTHLGRAHVRPAARSTSPSVPVVLPATSTGSAATPPAAATSYFADPTREPQVATDLIAAINARSNGGYSIRATPDNVSLLDTWMDNEGGLWADNPLNTSLDAARYPHQVTAAGQNTGIPVFPTIKIGIDATATTLLSNPAYVGILWVLSAGTASCETFARAVMATPWAASHYGGNPAHFCGNTGASGTPGGTSACLRLHHGNSRSGPSRMPGACGRRTSASGPVSGRGGLGHSQKSKAAPAPASSRHRGGSAPGAAASRHAHGASHVGRPAHAGGARRRH
jgi:hypothetical protein